MTTPMDLLRGWIGRLNPPTRPGGDEVVASAEGALAQSREPARPRQAPTGSPLLYREASRLAPGEWRAVKTRLPEGGPEKFKAFQTVSAPPDKRPGSADGMGWTERLVEYRGTLMLPLMRSGFQTALIVMDAEGRWTRTNEPPGLPIARGGRRPYNRWFRADEHAYFAPSDSDMRMGYFLRTPLASPGRFEPYGVPIGDTDMVSVGNFSVCYADAWDRFVAYTQVGKVWSWKRGAPAWQPHWQHLPRSERPTGHAGTVLWNPVRREALCIGGQRFGSAPDTSFRVLVLRDPAHGVVRLDATKPDGTPMGAITSGSSRFLVHPRTGEYLCLYRDGVMYRSEDGAQWRVYQDLNEIQPWGAYEKYCPWTWLEDTDVIVMVSHIRGVWLHRYKA
jgi:hypothetical protein